MGGQGPKTYTWLSGIFLNILLILLNKSRLPSQLIWKGLRWKFFLAFNFLYTTILESKGRALPKRWGSAFWKPYPACLAEPFPNPLQWTCFMEPKAPHRPKGWGHGGLTFVRWLVKDKRKEIPHNKKGTFWLLDSLGLAYICQHCVLPHQMGMVSRSGFCPGKIRAKLSSSTCNWSIL